MKFWRVLLCLFACVLAFHADAAGSAPPRFKIDVWRIGQFKITGQITNTAAPDTAAGQTSEHSGAELISSETKLKAVQGAVFGYSFRLRGVADGVNADFQMRVLHPAMRGRDGKTQTVSTVPLEVYGVAGFSEDDILYILSEDFEVLPGKWTLQLLHKGSVVISREFQLD